MFVRSVALSSRRTWLNGGAGYRSRMPGKSGGSSIGILPNARKGQIMSQSIPIKPFRIEWFVLEVQFRRTEKHRVRCSPGVRLKTGSPVLAR